MTVPISLEKIVKILRLYFDGVPQGKIARLVKVTQSTVSETIGRYEEDVRKYGLPAASEKYGIYEQMGALASLSVELRKAKIVVEEAKNGAKLLQEISEAGVNSSEIRSFLVVCKEVKNKNFLHAAIKLVGLQDKHDMSYDEVIKEYENKVMQSQRLSGDIEQLKIKKIRLNSDTKRLDSSFNKRLNDCNLNIRKLDYVLGIVPQELRKNRLNSQEKQELLKSIHDAGDIFAYLKLARKWKSFFDDETNKLKIARTAVQADVENLYETRNTYTIQIEEKESELSGLITGIKYANKILSRMAGAEERKKENITTARAILSFLASKNSQTLCLDDIITTLQCAKTAQIKGMKEWSIELTESARKKLGKYIIPLVDNELVSKVLLDSKEREVATLKQEIDNNCVPRSELDAAKAELENDKARFNQLEELSKDSQRLYEDNVNKLIALNSQEDEVIKKLKEENSKVVSELDESQSKLTELTNAMKQLYLWQKAHKKPEELTDTELAELMKLLEGVRLKRIPAKFLSNLLGKIFFKK